MSWTTNQIGIDELRAALSDGPTDKLAHDKRVLGRKNGTNTRFKTFERRRVTDFTATPATGSPEGVYLNNELVLVSGIASDSPITGSFVLKSAPDDDGTDMTATYYWQYFVDPELQTFLEKAMSWLGKGTDYTVLDDGLIPAALEYAKYQAYSKLALWFLQNASEAFMLEDKPDEKKNTGVVAEFNRMSAAALKQATTLRDTFYTRQGQSLSPLFGTAGGNVRDPMPRR